MTNNTKATDEHAFGKIRSFIWPIHRFELKKFLPMLFMFFCISFNYTILRDTKDALVVTEMGAEAIPFLKVWGVLPFAFLFMAIFNKLSNNLSKEKLFFWSFAPFIAYFALFNLAYSYRDALHPHQFCDWLQSILPVGFTGLIGIIRFWSYSTFYIMAELWGSVCLSLLFWGFANQITKFKESKRFYALLGLGANAALIFSGLFIKWAAKPMRSIELGLSDAWQGSLYWLTGTVVVLGITTLLVHKWMYKSVLTDPRFYDPDEAKPTKKKKKKPSLKDSMKMLLNSKYLGLLAILVISYGMCINMIEVTWKSQVKLQFPVINDYINFMGTFSMATGFFTIIMILCVGAPLLRKMNWRFSALMTPIVILITGSLFLSFMMFKDSLGAVYGLLGMSPVLLAVILGMIQNILSKSTKYSLFDPTKEMAYIPLDSEMKTKGKAAIDVVGARLGKSGGSLLQGFMIVTLGSAAVIAPYVSVLILVVVTVWILSASSLSKLFKKAVDKQNAEKETTIDSPEAKGTSEDTSTANSIKEEPATNN